MHSNLSTPEPIVQAPALINVALYVCIDFPHVTSPPSKTIGRKTLKTKSYVHIRTYTYMYVYIYIRIHCYSPCSPREPTYPYIPPTPKCYMARGYRRPSPEPTSPGPCHLFRVLGFGFGFRIYRAWGLWI